MSALDLSHLTLAQLKDLQRNVSIGDIMRGRVDEAIRSRLGIDVNTPKRVHAPVEAGPKMNETEKRYASVLEMRVRAGEIKRWWFGSIVFRTGAGRTTYKPDFVVELPDYSIEVHEVKGAHVWDDAREKFKTAALLYRWARWIMLQWVDGEWKTVYDFARGGR